MVREREVDLGSVQGGGRDDGGVRHGRCLVAYAEAVMGGDPAAIARTRAALAAAIGAAGVVDTAAVIAMFNVVDRVADATGIPIDSATREFRNDIGRELGMGHLAPEERPG